MLIAKIPSAKKMSKPARHRSKKAAGKRPRAARSHEKVKSSPGASATGTRRPRGPRRKPVVIDVHAHILVPEVMRLTYEQSQYAHTVAGKSESSGAQRMPELLFQRMTQAPLRLAQMDATGVDIQVISPSIMQQCTYGLEPEQALALERTGNETVAEVVARHPDRLVGLGLTVPKSSDNTVADLTKHIDEFAATYGKLIAEMGIKAE
jgi:aminocarboxymuconate-semialdehyde decarboxylase